MDGKKSIQELTVAFDRALVAAGYSESRLTNFRTVIKRLLIFGAAQGIECYSSSVGKKFLEKCYPVEFDGRLVHELPCTTQYAWRTITLLNDFNTHGAFFRARRLRGNLHLLQSSRTSVTNLVMTVGGRVPLRLLYIGGKQICANFSTTCTQTKLLYLKFLTKR